MKFSCDNCGGIFETDEECGYASFNDPDERVCDKCHDEWFEHESTKIEKPFNGEKHESRS